MRFRVWLAFAVLAASSDAAAAETPMTIAIEHIPLREAEPGETRVGRLVFRDGVVLKSDDPRFGGISGLAVSADGMRFLAVTDEGSWIAGRIVYDGDGRISAVTASAAPMLDGKGKPISGKTLGDAESLAVLSGEAENAVVAVGFERTARIWRYDLTEGLLAKPVPIPTPAELQEAPRNGGLEALRRAGGRLVLVTEDFLDVNGNTIGWLLPVEGGEGERFALRRDFPFAPTDAAMLPGGDLLVLERSYTPLGGPGMRLQRIARGDLKAGPAAEAETLAQMGAGYSIDNMEGLAVREGASGETLIYVISDDNFNPLQRTLLLIFVLED